MSDWISLELCLRQAIFRHHPTGMAESQARSRGLTVQPPVLDLDTYEMSRSDDDADGDDDDDDDLDDLPLQRVKGLRVKGLRVLLTMPAAMPADHVQRVTSIFMESYDGVRALHIAPRERVLQRGGIDAAACAVRLAEARARVAELHAKQARPMVARVGGCFCAAGCGVSAPYLVLVLRTPLPAQVKLKATAKLKTAMVAEMEELRAEVDALEDAPEGCALPAHNTPAQKPWVSPCRLARNSPRGWRGWFGPGGMRRVSWRQTRRRRGSRATSTTRRALPSWRASGGRTWRRWQRRRHSRA